MKAITALIAEDEPLMRERLREKLAQAWPDLAIVAEAADGDAALAAFARHRPALAFLDIRMPGRSGLDVAAAIGESCHVVFVTAYDEYAVQAFQAGAVDYLLKPLEIDRLEAAVQRLRRKVATAPPDLSALIATLRSQSAPVAPRLTWLKAAVGRQVKLIAVDDVVYFQSDTKYTRVVLADSEALIRTPLKDLIAELDAERFWQIHRGTVVNVRCIAGVLREDAERQSVLLKSRPEKLAVSRQFAHRFRQM